MENGEGGEDEVVLPGASRKRGPVAGMKVREERSRSRFVVGADQ